MTSLQSKFLFISCLLLLVKASFLLLVYIIAKKIEKRGKAVLKAQKIEKQDKVHEYKSLQNVNRVIDINVKQSGYSK